MGPEGFNRAGPSADMDRRTRGGTPPAAPARRRALLRWFAAEARPWPWRQDRDPYRIWIAEVLLQQTRVDQVVGHYRRFLARFPDLHRLARAREQSVLKVWQGAGYYGRARALRWAARAIRDRHGGTLPRHARELVELPGFGPYISAAVASLAFGERVPALEANGLRVITRWTRFEGDGRRGPGRRELMGRLAAELPRKDPGRFQEAVMELGERICRPRAPLCGLCPVAAWCRARRELPRPDLLPVPVGRRRPRPRHRASVVLLTTGGRLLAQRRPSGGLLGGLWELPGGHISVGESPEAAARRELLEETGIRAGPLEPLGTVRHAYSHFEVELHLFTGAPDRAPPPPRSDQRWLTAGELRRRPIPRATEKLLDLAARLHRLPTDRRPRPGSLPRRSARRPGRAPSGGR